MTLPGTLVTRSALHERLTDGAGKRLTVVVGSAGAGRSVLLSSWSEVRALAAGDHHTAQQHLQAPSPGDLTLRRTLVRQLLLAAAAIGRGDRMAASVLDGALATARRGGFCNTVVTTAHQVTSYLVEHAAPAGSDPFTEQLITAALQVRSAQPGTSRPGRIVTEPLTPAERRVLELQAPWLAPPAEWPEEASVSTAEAEARPIRSLIPARLHRLGWSPFHTRMVAGLVGGGMPSRGWCRGSWPSRRCR